MSAAETHAALERMAAIAARLGEAFGREAEAAQTHERRIELFHLFDRCFFSVRVSIALQLRLRREAGTLAEREADPPEVLEREPADRDDAHDRPERFDERDRDRETERADLPILLRTLEGVCDAAEALPGPRPAELPTLRELLVQVKGRTPATPARRAPALRSRLTGSTAPLVLERPSLRAALQKRRATGPP